MPDPNVNQSMITIAQAPAVDGVSVVGTGLQGNPLRAPGGGGGIFVSPDADNLFSGLGTLADPALVLALSDGVSVAGTGTAGDRFRTVAEHTAVAVVPQGGLSGNGLFSGPLSMTAFAGQYGPPADQIELDNTTEVRVLNFPLTQKGMSPGLGTRFRANVRLAVGGLVTPLSVLVRLAMTSSSSGPIIPFSDQLIYLAQSVMPLAVDDYEVDITIDGMFTTATNVFVKCVDIVCGPVKPNNFVHLAATEDTDGFDVPGATYWAITAALSDVASAIVTYVDLQLFYDVN